MQGEGVFGQQLTFGFKTGVCVPELSRENEATKSLDTTRVDIRRVLGRAREKRFLELASVVQLAQARVQLSIGCACKQSCCSNCCESTAHRENELRKDTTV